jgi:hypothetical protein
VVALLLFPWLYLLLAIFSRSSSTAETALALGVLFSPLLVALTQEGKSSRIYVARSSTGEDLDETEDRRPLSPPSSYTFREREGDSYSPIIEGGSSDAPAPVTVRLACRSRPHKQTLFRHPLMICYYLWAGPAIWFTLFESGWYMYLIFPLGCIFAGGTLAWLGAGGGSWMALEISGGQAWLFDASRYSERVLAAAPAGNGIEVTLEFWGKRRLWFPGGSLLPAMQQDIALNALRERAKITDSPAPPRAEAGGAAPATEGAPAAEVLESGGQDGHEESQRTERVSG